MHHPTDRILYATAFVTPVVELWLEREIVQWVHHFLSVSVKGEITQYNKFTPTHSTTYPLYKYSLNTSMWIYLDSILVHLS